MPPEELARAYNAWRGKREVRGVPKYHEIFLIAPMLLFLRGPATRKGKRYWFYKCKHFIRRGDGKGSCSIYSIRPSMCSGFPWYEVESELRIGRQLPKSPSHYEGCRFNE